MQKPNNYDGVQASGDFIPVRLGGHHLVIKQVQEQQTKTGKDMIVVLFDMASGDDQAVPLGAFQTDEIENDIMLVIEALKDF